MNSKRKIAVLWDGIGSLSTIFGITWEPEWQEKYGIINALSAQLKPGWATRGPGAQPVHYDRIEEYGSTSAITRMFSA